MSENDPDQKPTKRTYVAPEVTRVPLRPQEAVLGFCKTTGSAGVGDASCNSAPQCQDVGS